MKYLYGLYEKYYYKKELTFETCSVTLLSPDNDLQVKGREANIGSSRRSLSQTGRTVTENEEW